MGLAFAAAERAARGVEVADDKVDGVAGEAGTEHADDLAQAGVVGLLLRGGPAVQQLFGGDHVALGQPGQQGDAGGLAADRDVEHPAIVGGRDGAGYVNAGQRSERADGAQPGGGVVISGDDDHLAIGARQPEQRVVHQPLGLRRRRGRVEQVTGDEDQLACLVLRDGDQLAEHRLRLAEARPTTQGLAHVPVGRMEDPHRSPRLPVGYDSTGVQRPMVSTAEGGAAHGGHSSACGRCRVGAIDK